MRADLGKVYSGGPNIYVPTAAAKPLGIKQTPEGTSVEVHLADTQIIVKPCYDINMVVLSLGGVDRIVDPRALSQAMYDMVERNRGKW